MPSVAKLTDGACACVYASASSKLPLVCLFSAPAQHSLVASCQEFYVPSASRVLAAIKAALRAHCSCQNLAVSPRNERTQFCQASVSF